MFEHVALRSVLPLRLAWVLTRVMFGVSWGPFWRIPNGLADRAIRYIIHYDLPKSFEGKFRLLRKMGGDMVPGYYQETGTSITSGRQSAATEHRQDELVETMKYVLRIIVGSET